MWNSSFQTNLEVKTFCFCQWVRWVWQIWSFILVLFFNKFFFSVKIKRFSSMHHLRDKFGRVVSKCCSVVSKSQLCGKYPRTILKYVLHCLTCLFRPLILSDFWRFLFLIHKPTHSRVTSHESLLSLALVWMSNSHLGP